MQRSRQACGISIQGMYTVADLRGREGRAPWRSKFFQFHAVLRTFNKIVCWRSPSRGVGAPSSGKSWIRHWYIDLTLKCPCWLSYQVMTELSVNQRIPSKMRCPLVNLSGGARDTCSPLAPMVFNFMQFLVKNEKLAQIIVWHVPLPPREIHWRQPGV